MDHVSKGSRKRPGSQAFCEEIDIATPAALVKNPFGFACIRDKTDVALSAPGMTLGNGCASASHHRPADWPRSTGYPCSKSGRSRRDQASAKSFFCAPNCCSCLFHLSVRDENNDIAHTCSLSLFQEDIMRVAGPNIKRHFLSQPGAPHLRTAPKGQHS